MKGQRSNFGHILDQHFLSAFQRRIQILATPNMYFQKYTHFLKKYLFQFCDFENCSSLTDYSVYLVGRKVPAQNRIIFAIFLTVCTNFVTTMTSSQPPTIAKLKRSWSGWPDDDTDAFGGGGGGKRRKFL